MTDESSSIDKPAVGVKIAGTVLTLFIAVVVAVALVFEFVGEERERDLRAWQVRLGIVADSRAAAVDGWLRAQLGEMSGLADNLALRLYVTQITLTRGDGGADVSPEAQYLGNLLTVTAARSGFKVTPLGPEVRANAPRTGLAGIAILDIEGKVLAATTNFPPMERQLRAFLRAAPRGERGLYDLHPGADGKPALGFIAPVYGNQLDPAPKNQIAWVLGLKPVASALYPLLRQPGAVGKSSETLLIRARGAVVQYLSPLADGVAPLSKQLARNTRNLAAAYALDQPGGFALKRDYRDREVLIVSRRLTSAPWLLVRKIDRAEALAESETRLGRLLFFLLLALAVVVAAIVGVWRHGASRRAASAAARFEDMARRFETQRDFLTLLTDSQPNAIFIVDGEGRYRFANDVAAREAGITKDDMRGKTLAAVLGPEFAKRYGRLNREALEDQKEVALVHRFEEGGHTRIVQSKHIPMAGAGGQSDEVLVVQEDITAAITERERRERILAQIVETLVTVVDRRDPNAAHHSARVARVAREVAQEMGLDEVLAGTAATAGELMNLGKIMVPTEILTRKGKLTAKEFKQIRDSIQTAADLLTGIEFDGPVVETLRQSQEHWDGSGGPKRLKGEKILVTARVVAVANAFVALVSPRAHRPGAGFDQAVETLLEESSKAFDRTVVAALINTLYNRGGLERWADFVGKSGKTRKTRKR